MAVNNVVLYFPMGSGGNIVRNILSLDTRFEFLDNEEFQLAYPTVDSRYKFLTDYYNIPVDSSSWLKREWNIRTRLYTQYYISNKIEYWNTDEHTIYMIHGTSDELLSIGFDKQLRCYDRTKIDNGEREEMLSPWTLQDCTHIFLLPDDIDKITKIYYSKNYTLNQFSHIDNLDARQREAELLNRITNSQLHDCMEFLIRKNKTVHCYRAEDLFNDTGAEIILDIASKLNLTIPVEYVENLHSNWLTSTKTLYYNAFNKELTL